MKPIISASILNADFSCLKDQIQESERAGIDWLHVDVMDGHFVPNLSMGPIIVETCRKISKLPIDTHLMIENPDQFLEYFAKAGTTYIDVHIEGNAHIHRTLQTIRSLGCKAGIVINPGTPAESLSAVLDIVDLILIMTVNPGFGGQLFIESQMKKISHVKRMINDAGLTPLIEVDGGITVENLPSIRKAGADIFVIGSAIYSNEMGIKKTMEQFNASLK